MCTSKNPTPTCANDSAIEPNDTIQTAYATPVAAMTKHLLYDGLAICPATDRDFFTVNITMGGQNLEAIATTQSTVSLSLLNAGGSPIAVGSPTNGGVRAYAPSLPIGTYFASVSAADKANYSLALTVTP
jgi:hypothetical protein